MKNIHRFTLDNEGYSFAVDGYGEVYFGQGTPDGDYDRCSLPGQHLHAFIAALQEVERLLNEAP